MKKNLLSVFMLSFLLSGGVTKALEGDTIGLSSKFVPRFAPSGSTTMIKDPEGGYVFGTGVKAPFQDQNGAPLGQVTGIAQGYELNEQVRITHIMAYIPVKRSNSASPSSKLVFGLHPIQNSKAVEGAQQTPVAGPAASVASVDVSYADIQDEMGTLTVAALSAPVDMNEDFAISCMLNDFISKSDSVGFLSDKTGDGLGMKYNWRMVSITNLWDKWFTSSTWQLNVNVALFAVTENSTSLSEAHPEKSQASLFPNPAGDLVTLSWTSLHAQTWKLTWMDAAGRLIQQRELGHYPAGTNQIRQDLSALKAGNYIYLLEGSDGSRIAHSFIVNR